MTHSAAECKKTHSNSFRELLNAFKNAMCRWSKAERGGKKERNWFKSPERKNAAKGKVDAIFKGTTSTHLAPPPLHVCVPLHFSAVLLVFCASEILNHGASAGASIYRSDPSLCFFKTKVKSWNMANGRSHLGATLVRKARMGN